MNKCYCLCHMTSTIIFLLHSKHWLLNWRECIRYIQYCALHMKFIINLNPLLVCNNKNDVRECVCFLFACILNEKSIYWRKKWIACVQIIIIAILNFSFMMFMIRVCVFVRHKNDEINWFYCDGIMQISECVCSSYKYIEHSTFSLFFFNFFFSFFVFNSKEIRCRQSK